MIRPTLALTVAAFSLLSPAWADVTATVGLTLGQSVDLDTGAYGPPAAVDLIYTGPGGYLAPIGEGTGVVLASATGAAAFDKLTQADLSALTTYRSIQIPEQALRPGYIILAKTNTGKYSKILVANHVLGTLILTFNTFTASPVLPTIDSVQNNYGQIPAGLPNYALAPGSLFFVKGANLSTVNDGQTLRSSAAPGLQNTVGGVTVTVTVNGISFNCPLYYLSPTQINAVLPGNTPVGRGTLTVTNNLGRSTAFNLTVAQSAFGIIHYNGTLAAAYDANNALLTRLNAANPNQTIVIWGSGIGGDPANDDRLFPQKTNNLVNVPLQVLVGGRSATILYRGRSQYPGVDQIVVTLPANSPTGCYIPLSVITGNLISNGVTISVAASGKTCADPDDPLTPAVVQTLNGKPTIRTGALLVSRYTDLTSAVTYVSASGSFQSTSGAAFLAGEDQTSLGHCVTAVSGSGSPSLPSAPIDAGLALNVTGPQGTLLLNKQPVSDSTDYRATVPQTFVTAAGGNYVFTNFSGGTDVQGFNTILSVPANFSLTNSAALATIDRQGAIVTWSGGTTAAYVLISGSADSASTGASARFTCRAPAAPGQFTIPAATLMGLPSGTGYLGVVAIGSQLSFTAPGLDFGYLYGAVAFYRAVRY